MWASFNDQKYTFINTHFVAFINGLLRAFLINTSMDVNTYTVKNRIQQAAFLYASEKPGYLGC